MARAFTDNSGKSVVRELWNTPLLRHLHRQHGVRYRYLGLPGADLIDVRLWRDMIDEVIAFQIPDKDGRRTEYRTLTATMRKYGIAGRAFCGSFEEVVLRRKDIEGQDYAQSNVITLYNLDFCDEISSRVETREHGRQCWRFEAIGRLLQDQHDCYQQNGGPRHFILMLTVRNQITPENIYRYLPEASMRDDARSFYVHCSMTNPIPSDRHRSLRGSHSWTLKALLYNKLHSYFAGQQLSALFFPQVHYLGTPAAKGQIDSPMLHWLVLCRLSEQAVAVSEIWPNQYLPKPSVKAQRVLGQGMLTWDCQTGEELPSSGGPDAVRWLSEHGTSILDGICDHQN